MKLSSIFTSSKTKKNLLVILVLGLAVLVRIWKMEYFPLQSDADEMAFIFAGQNLIVKNSPISWTSFPADYGKKRIIYSGEISTPEYNIDTYYNLVYPWFDHPYLLPLIEGNWLRLFNYQPLDNIPSLIYRLPMVFLAACTLYLVFLISRYLFGFYPALFSLILMGFTPSFFFAQRMVVGENLYIPFMLLAIYLLFKDNSWIKTVPLSVMAGLAKITGLITIPLIAFYLLLKKKYKQAIFYVSVSVIIFCIFYFLYGLLIDWPQFMQMLKRQSFRFLGWKTPINIFSKPGFYSIILPDAGYYLILFLGLGSLLTSTNRTTKAKFLSMAVFSSLLLVWLTSDEVASLGWYKLPFFSFLTISAAGAINSNLNYSTILLMTVATISSYGLVQFVDHPYPEFWPFRFLLIGIFGSLFLLNLLSKLNLKIKYGLIILLSIVYILNGFYVADRYYDSICQHKHCQLPILTLQTLIKSKFLTVGYD